MSVVADAGVQPSVSQSEPEKVAILSVRQLMWLRFKRNRLALVGAWVLIAMYLMALFAPFLAPYGVRETHDAYASTAPHLSWELSM